MIKLRREGIAQHAVDALPGGQHLRARDGGGRPAVAVEDLARGHGNAEIAGIEPERIKPRGLRMMPAKSPLIEPPTTSARPCLAIPVIPLFPQPISQAAKVFYIVTTFP